MNERRKKREAVVAKLSASGICGVCVCVDMIENRGNQNGLSRKAVILFMDGRSFPFFLSLIVIRHHIDLYTYLQFG